MNERVGEFLSRRHEATMVTLRSNGTPHVAKVFVGLVDGKLWSSGTQPRVRTRHLRRDPRSTLLVMGEDPWHWLGLECAVTIHDGPDAPDKNLALYRALRGEPDDVDEYRQAMVREQRLIYEFAIQRAYGSY